MTDRSSRGFDPARRDAGNDTGGPSSSSDRSHLEQLRAHGARLAQWQRDSNQIDRVRLEDLVHNSHSFQSEAALTSDTPSSTRPHPDVQVSEADKRLAFKLDHFEPDVANDIHTFALKKVHETHSAVQKLRDEIINSAAILAHYTKNREQQIYTNEQAENALNDIESRLKAFKSDNRDILRYSEAKDFIQHFEGLDYTFDQERRRDTERTVERPEREMALKIARNVSQETLSQFYNDVNGGPETRKAVTRIRMFRGMITHGPTLTRLTKNHGEATEEIAIKEALILKEFLDRIPAMEKAKEEINEILDSSN